MNSKITVAYSPVKIIKGVAVAIASFAVLGTVSALWDNAFFVRMTPTGAWEVALLATLSILLGVYVVVRRPFCSIKTAGVGGVLGFLGVACPVCNKILLLLFGGELLLTYFEPVRVYVAAAGVFTVLAAVLWEWTKRPNVPHSVPWSAKKGDNALVSTPWHEASNWEEDLHSHESNA